MPVTLPEMASLLELYGSIRFKNADSATMQRQLGDDAALLHQDLLTCWRN